ncbi:MAG: hypothetical protein NZ742_06320 [Acidobacteria bacterium]|nr:hypothetical protein [Acidobacteriota bacterium]MDW7984481.1 hypothetical protein [Acidobacteriota bacterium]
MDMNAFSPVDYGLIPVEQYFRPKGKRQLDYVSSMGCHYRCAFCADPFVYGRRWVALSPERVGDEIEFLWRRYSFEDLAFQGETFFTFEKRVIAIVEEFLRRDLLLRGRLRCGLTRGTGYLTKGGPCAYGRVSGRS